MNREIALMVGGTSCAMKTIVSNFAAEGTTVFFVVRDEVKAEEIVGNLSVSYMAFF